MLIADSNRQILSVLASRHPPAPADNQHNQQNETASACTGDDDNHSGSEEISDMVPHGSVGVCDVWPQTEAQRHPRGWVDTSELIDTGIRSYKS